MMTPLGNKTCFVTINSAIWRKFGFENLVTTNRFLTRGKWNEVLVMVGFKGLQLSVHGMMLFRIKTSMGIRSGLME